MAFDGCVIFLHVPRAAGQTLNSVIRRQYDPGEVLRYAGPVWSFDRIPGSLDRSIRVIAGHIPFGIHRDIRGPTTYITLLRDPVERVLSLYRYIIENPRHPLHGEARGLSLEEFLDSDLDRYEVHDGQTRQISGVQAEPDRRALEVAKDNLREHFSVVGLVERFDETLMLLRKRFGWRMPFYVKKNMTSRRLFQSEVPGSVLDAITERNRLDIELYGFVRDLFNRIVQEQGYLFGVQLLSFRLFNGLAQGYDMGRQILRLPRSPA